MQLFIPLGAVNFLLVSVYLVPVWTRDALRVLNSPFGALHERSQAAAVAIIRNTFGFAVDDDVVISNVLAGFKLMIVAAMVAFLVDFVRSVAGRCRPDPETIDAALALAFVLIIVTVLPVLGLDDPAIVRGQAAQIMLICGAVIVTLVERDIAARARQPAARELDVIATPVEQRIAA